MNHGEHGTPRAADGAGVRIRRYTSADEPDFRRLVGALHETVQPFDPDLAPVEEIRDAYAEHLLRRVAESQGVTVVAEREGHLEGYGCLFGQVRPADPDEVDAPYAYVADLYVSPGLRGAGVGRDLMAHLQEHARRLGVHKIELQVLAGNEGARRFYEELGFRARTVVMTRRLRGGSTESSG